MSLIPATILVFLCPPLSRHWTRVSLFRAALVIGVLAVVRAVLLDRAPRRELHGAEPVIGSLDTWPAVPRKPAA